MEKYASNSMFKNIFLYLVKYINEKNSRKLNIVITSSNIIETQADSNMFFNSGQLLMLLYIANIKNLSSNSIKYNNSVFYLNYNSYVVAELEYFKETTASREITYDIIRNSVYYKRFLPKDINRISDANLNDILRGFQDTYTILMKEKFNLLEYLDKYKFDTLALELIKYLKLLNPNDMRKQLKLISIKMRKNHKNVLVDKLIYLQDNIVQINKEVLDVYIQNAVIGYGKYGMELMWMEYKNNKLQAMEKEIIYMAVVLAYVGYTEDNMYYIENSKQCINSILNYTYFNKELDNSYMNLLIDLNKCIRYDKLDRFIEKNINIHDKVSYKEDCDIDKLIRKYLNDGALNGLKDIVI